MAYFAQMIFFVFGNGLPEANSISECDRELHILQNALRASCEKYVQHDAQ